jgi:hypothetical protein
MSRPRIDPLPVIEAIRKALRSLPRHVFSPVELVSFIQEQLFQLGSSLGPEKVAERLLKSSDLTEITLKSPDYPPISRYVVGSPSPFEIGQSLRKGAYLSHATAVFLLGLTDQDPKTIYVNKEQSPKPVPATSLTQERITRAFQGSPRRTNYVLRFGDYQYALLSGKNTKDFGVEPLVGSDGVTHQVTDLERTLTDIAVRPTYAGGVFQVLEAYRASAARLSVTRMAAVLDRLDYVYPYNQVIGYYLEKAGLPPEQTAPLRGMGLQWDFYLTHGLRDAEYVESWRLWVPRGF